jgi:hypothetical protein
MRVPFILTRVACWVALLQFLPGPNHSLAAPTNIFLTQFETAQGYNSLFDLAGQNSWTKFGSGGNGLVANFFQGQGQQAYVGFDAPTPGDTTLFLWRPVNFSPIASGLALVKFTTLMSIEDSTTNRPYYDFFQWSVFNISGDRLFTVDFDNFSTNISYALDGTNLFVNTGVKFAPGTAYTLTILMNFASNRWSATLDSALIATNLPMTTTGLELTLGDVDAVWDLFDVDFPGNNYMLFDNYAITAEALTPPRPRVTLVSRNSNGQTLVRLNGLNGSRFAIEASTNFVNWTALTTNRVMTGSFDHLDTGAAALTRRLYRGRWVP